MSESERQKEQIAGLYHRVAAAYGQVGPNFFAYAGRQLVARVALSLGQRVLDVAADRGANLFPAAAAVGPAGHVIGIDLAAGMVAETSAEIARRQVMQAEMLQMDAEHLAFADASFDAVLCSFAIFLFPHLEQALAEFLRVLRPGGKLGIAVARDVDALSRWYGAHLTAYQERYSFPLSAGGGAGSNYAELPQYLIQAGFSAARVEEEQADFVYANAQQWWDARWTHGSRYALEQMPPEVLARFKAEVLARLAEEAQARGIQETLRFHHVLAEKPLDECVPVTNASQQ
jgi:O-methyltransferase/aklanonic acid methyltransferase